MAKEARVINVGRGPGRGPALEKPKNPKVTIGRLMNYLMEYKGQMVLVILGILGSSGASVASTYFLKPIINDYIVPFIGKEHPNLAAFASMLCLMAVVYLIGVGCGYLYKRLMVNIATGAMRRIRTDLFTHMQSLPIRYFDTHTHGELMSRYTNDTDTLREMISEGIPQLISSGITIVGVFSMMLVLSWQLTILAVLLLAVLLRLVKVIGRKSANFFIKQQRALGQVNGYIEEMIEGQKVVKVFCHEDTVKEEFAQLNENLCYAASNAGTFSNIMGPVSNNMGHVTYAFTAAAGATLAIFGVLDLGTIGSFLQYTRSFNQPISMLSQQFNILLTALAGAERIFAVIDEQPETDDGYVTLVNVRRKPDGALEETKEHTGLWAWRHPHGDGSLTYTQVRGAVEFEDVVFGYEENKIVLDGITLKARPGEKIAFVGSTGAGKTTITNLINRFYDVPDGKIRYDGININKIKKDDLRQSLSMVLQDTHLFTGTVRENIRYGKLDATDEEIEAAAKLANAHFFISHLPQGYDTILTSDGANLSQGQRQLLAIARAAVADPPVLILDEATSSIDTRTEALIEKGMDTLMEGRTVFVIAHRLSTVRNSNIIIVLEHGKIIEEGDHQALIAQHGKYYQLYTGLFELS
ncbi:MAG: ABC transporter ATP-binding protein [Oscillospiraceae bacterium]|nr:ABC transporter ATP-binding protein [Oscillospiraceae bacterium]